MHFTTIPWGPSPDYSIYPFACTSPSRTYKQLTHYKMRRRQHCLLAHTLWAHAVLDNERTAPTTCYQAYYCAGNNKCRPAAYLCQNTSCMIPGIGIVYPHPTLIGKHTQSPPWSNRKGENRHTASRSLLASPDNRDKTDLAKQKKHPQQSCMVGISQAMKPHSSD